MTAGIALLNMAAERGGTATLDRAHDTALPSAEGCRVLLTVSRPGVTKDVRHLEPEDLVARRDGRDEPLGETVEQLGGVVLGRAVRHGQPSSTTRPVADLFTRTACISVPSGRTNVRFSFVSPTDVARA